MNRRQVNHTMQHFATTTVRFSALACAATLLAACGDDIQRTPVQTFGEAASLDQHVVWLDVANDEAILLDVSVKNPAPETTRYPIDENPVTIQRRNRHNELLLLSRGAGSGDGVLSVLGPTKVVKTFELGSRFNALTQSSDGRFAFVRFTADNEDEDSLLFNPNEVAVIDLDASAKDGVTLRSLRGFGKIPRFAEFSPEMEIAGETRRLLVVCFDSHISILDLNHLDRPEYTVEFSQSTNIDLAQVKFSPEEQKIYLTGANSNDVFVLTLLPSGSNRVNDFDPSLNQLGAGRRPVDMAIYEQDGVRRLLAVSSDAALIIESGSNRVTTVALPTLATRVLLYTGTAPFDDELEQRALLYSPGISALTFLDLDQVEERTTRNLEVLPLSGGIASLTPLENNMVLVLRSNGLGMLNLDGRFASELSSSVGLSQAIPTPELNRLWVRPEQRSALAYLDYSSDQSTPGQVSLDEPISQMLLFTNMKTPRVVLTHASASGHVTVLDAVDPADTSKAVSLNGVFYSHLFE